MAIFFRVEHGCKNPAPIFFCYTVLNLTQHDFKIFGEAKKGCRI